MFEKFGENLRHLREQNKLTQKALAQKLHIKRSTLSKYETGDREPGLKTLVKIADVLEVSVDKLLGRNPTNYSNPTEGASSNSKEESNSEYVADKSSVEAINMIAEIKKIINKE